MGTIAENPFTFGTVGGLQGGVVNPVTVASATTMPAATSRISTVSGTAAIQLITVPWTGFTGQIAYIPTGAFTAVTTGTATATGKPVGIAFTAVTGKMLYLEFDGTSWYPSYVS